MERVEPPSTLPDEPPGLPFLPVECWLHVAAFADPATLRAWRRSCRYFAHVLGSDVALAPLVDALLAHPRPPVLWLGGDARKRRASRLTVLNALTRSIDASAVPEPVTLFVCAGTLSSRFALRAPRASAVALEQWVVGALVARVQCAQVEIEGDLVVGATLLARDPLGKRVFRVHVVCMSSASPSALDRSVAKDGSWILPNTALLLVHRKGFARASAVRLSSQYMRLYSPLTPQFVVRVRHADTAVSSWDTARRFRPYCFYDTHEEGRALDGYAAHDEQQGGDFDDEGDALDAPPDAPPSNRPQPLRQPERPRTVERARYFHDADAYADFLWPRDDIARLFASVTLLSVVASDGVFGGGARWDRVALERHLARERLPLALHAVHGLQALLVGLVLGALVVLPAALVALFALALPLALRVAARRVAGHACGGAVYFALTLPLSLMLFLVAMPFMCIAATCRNVFFLGPLIGGGQSVLLSFHPTLGSTWRTTRALVVELFVALVVV